MVLTPVSPKNPSSLDADLAELAALTGFRDPTEQRPAELPKEQPPPPESVAADESGETGEQPLLDPEDLEDEDKEEAAKTKTPLWSNPIAKGLFIGALVGIGVGGIGMFLWTFQHVREPQNQIQAPVAAAPEAEPVDPAAGQQDEIGRLKTVTALGTQAQTLQQNQPTTTTVPTQASPQATPGQSPTTTRPTTANRPTPGQPTRVAPPARPISPPTRSYTPPARPVPPPTRSYTPPRTAMPTVAAATQVNPTDQWEQAMLLGSYGAVSYPEAEAASPTTTTAEAGSPATTQTSTFDTAQAYQDDEMALLTGVRRQVVTLLPGTTAAAQLVTPVIWAEDLDPAEQPQRFGLILSEPLLDSEGAIALPAGTQMVTQVDAISESGMVSLGVMAVVVPGDEGNHLVSVPAGAILISGEAGEPLIAEHYNNVGGSIASMDLSTALVGALGQVGEVLNRPRNEQTTTSPYLSSTSVSNGNANILGGLLQGGFDALSEQISDRHERQIQDILQRPHVWVVPAGVSLQVFVSSSFELSEEVEP